MLDRQPAFAAHQTLSGDRCRLMLRGELDLASAPLLEAGLREAERAGAKRLELDLSDLEFIDSTGLTVLIQANHAAELNGHTLSLCGLQPQVQRLFELTGTLDRFTFIDGAAGLL
jgi:anti-anti-sigma factor